jgi:hypothetical protein
MYNEPFFEKSDTVVFQRRCGPVLDRYKQTNKQTPWLKSASEPYRPSDRSLSAELVPTFADGGFEVVIVTDPYGRNLGFLDRSRYFVFQVAPQLYSRGSENLVEPGIEPGPLDL